MWNEMDRLQREVNRLFEPLRSVSGTSGNFPAVNIWTGEEDALLTAELPGVDPKDIDVTVKNDTVTIRGKRELEPRKENETYLRRERGEGAFVRSFALPFHVSADKVKAQYQKGILQLTLPKREEDKARKISVKGG